MTEIKVKDEGGDVITMVDFGEYRSSLFGNTVEEVAEINRKLPQFRFRDEDILLCSYPKAGCTWTFEILTMLLKGKPESPDYSKQHVMLEASSAENMTSLPSPRLLNTHLPYRRIPQDISNKKVKLVLVARNPKDVAVSQYNMMHGMQHYAYTGKFENWLPLFTRGDLAYDTFWRYYTDWEQVYTSQKHDIILMYFEDMKKDTLTEVRKLSDFLGVDMDDETLKSIVEKCQLKEMKTRYTTASLGVSSYRDGSKFHFMRKGEVGNWKNWFTVAQSEMTDRVIADEMKGSTLSLTYQL